MKTLNLILSLILFISIHSLKAQDFEYTYDAAGNRINRGIIVLKSTGNFSDNESYSIYNEETGMLAENTTALKSIADNIGIHKITIYPNPTRGQLVVQINNLPAEVNSRLIVYDLSGRTVLQEQNISEYTNVDLSNSPGGSYIMKIISGELIKEFKIIKK